MSRIQLARATGVSRATVKHYIDLGLLLKPKLTAPNMAYYDPACIERIILIRQLQAKRHLPLTVIADILRKDGVDKVERAFQTAQAMEADLLDSLSHRRESPVNRNELLAIEGVDERVLDELEKIGLVRPLTGSRGQKYDSVSRKVVQAVGVMRREGLTEEAGFDVRDLTLYRDQLKALVDAEIRLFSTRVLPKQDPRKAIRLMRTAMEGVDALVLAIRDRLLADYLKLARKR